MYRQKFEYFLNASLCLDFGGGWRANLSFGATNQYSGWYARMAFRGLKIGYGETYYNEQYIASYKELPSGETIKTSYLLGEQTVGTITAQVDRMAATRIKRLPRRRTRQMADQCRRNNKRESDTGNKRDYK